MAYGDFKDLPRRTPADKVLLEKVFNIAKNPKYDEYQRELAAVVYNFFDKKSSGGAVTRAQSETSATQGMQDKFAMPSQELAEELHKPVIRKLEKCKVYSSFIDNISGPDLADMQLISKCNKGICFLLCIINIYLKYAWVVSLKYKKGIIVTYAFQKILDQSGRQVKIPGCKPSNIWLDKSSGLYNRSMNS